METKIGEFVLRYYGLKAGFKMECGLKQKQYIRRTCHAIKPWLNYQTLLFNIVFVAQNMGWLSEQTMFDQTSNKAILRTYLLTAELSSLS